MDEIRPLLAAVLGDPISHSKSPRMHNYWLKQNKLNGYYIPIKVELEDFEETIRALVCMGFSGVNVTIPHKLSALKIADESSRAAQYIGAANTLTFTKENKIYKKLKFIPNPVDASIDNFRNFKQQRVGLLNKYQINF